MFLTALVAGVKPAGAATKIAKPERSGIAVVDFRLVQKVGVKDAGQIFAKILLEKLDAKKHELVGRARLAEILKPHGLTIAKVANNPDILKGKKIEGLRYLVVGTVSKPIELTVFAKVIDVTTGGVGRPIVVSARDVEAMKGQLAKLAKILSNATTSLKFGKPKTITLDLGGDVTMKLALIPAGKFLMGSPKTEADRKDSEGPQRQVTISKPFYMGVTEVTQLQYGRIVGRNPSKFKGPELPVERVSWNAASLYCAGITRLTGRGVRLPSEAQWEYACRAGSKTRFCFGDAEKDFAAHGWSKTNSGAKTHPVGRKKPNAFGLYDMHGNVWEWCRDWYDEKFYAAAKDVDPEQTKGSKYRVLRGGSWSSNLSKSRAASRYKFSPDNSFVHRIGFRVVIDAQ
jgi:formylglycine-generating enzyme required for sulfatase activity